MKQLLWIGGEYRPTLSYIKLKNPYNLEHIADIAVAEQEDVVAAIAAAHQATVDMQEIPAYKRAEILEKVASLLKSEREECARLIAEEAAKPVKAARAEVDRTIMTYTFAAHEARRIHGETVPMDAAPGGEGRLAFTIREPLGVIAAITPFNFPMNLVAHKVGPAIAAGNTVVLKPASQTPLSAYKIAEYFHHAGLPSGALNVVTGSGRVVGDILMKDERIKMITFTGSPEVGKYICENSGLKKVTLELGSNSAVIVDDGVSLEKIIPRIVTGAFSYQGQVCISIQRIFVHEKIIDQFVAQFIEETKKLKAGHPLDEQTDVSALITRADVERTKQWVDEAIANGAGLKTGGNFNERIFQPTVLVDVPVSEKISCEEVFAPVVHINRFTSMEEAINLVNDSKYGLQAGIFTNDIHYGLRAAKKLEVGGVMINEIPTFRVDQMPYGGVKLSGMGREGIKYAVEEMTELKLISFKVE
ncbi:acyl-CoA reductase-like NAD-dependent aldehyde dehydrogenase [Bacillus sp. SLBN-46]|uniref:aldehyde dehydrogenase family protein n=1 Tax=Bacillus sp. SLBN-46 TaxID=3042283 RepID=UPI00285BCCE5|nr:aldehyde dehydrogenase family protein [Bacillus sp. SLBN-46]MDR6122724.1 acyl-CoA reductase-like NAD-dependent aldehyde dehydrogenase [Bacillus sp. SLBN-46]